MNAGANQVVMDVMGAMVAEEKMGARGHLVAMDARGRWDAKDRKDAMALLALWA